MVHTLIFGGTLAGLAALWWIAEARQPGHVPLRDALAAPARALRWWAAGARARRAARRMPPDPWTRGELRAMRADLVAARSRTDRRLTPYRAYRRRQHLRAAGFRFAGGPLGSLP